MSTCTDRRAAMRLGWKWGPLRSFLAATAVGAIAWNTAALAGPIINVGTNWSVSFSAGSTGQATASVSNVGDDFAEFNGVALAFVLVPVAGSGTLEIIDFTAPATNPLFTMDPPEYFLLEQSMLDAPITVSGTDYYAYYPAFAANTTSFNEQIVASSSKNLGTLTFSAAEGTLGAWQVYLANQDVPQKTFFSRAAPYGTTSFDDLPAFNGSMVLIGSVFVVPEPSTLVGLATAGVAFGAITICRRRRKARAG